MSVELFGYTENGMTPMSWVNIALATCVTMCLQSYFSNYQMCIRDRYYARHDSSLQIARQIAWKENVKCEVWTAIIAQRCV